MSSQALRRGYEDLQSRSEAHEELIELMRNLPDQEAQYVLQSLRSGSGVQAILNQVKAGDLLLQLAVSPETRFRYEFPYRSEMPQEFVIDNPYLDSLVYEAASLYAPSQQPMPPGGSSSRRTPGLRMAEYGNLYLKPFHAAQVIEPRLCDARPSLWTTICDDDVLIRDLLGVFFRCEYHFTAAFQKDLFLEDMISQREDFCSPLLVNVTLAYSCVQSSQRFLEAAARLIRYCLGLLPPVQEPRRVLEPPNSHVSLPRRGKAALGARGSQAMRHHGTSRHHLQRHP